MNDSGPHHRSDLQRVAKKAMLDRGLLPEFAKEVMDQLARIGGPASADDGDVRDLRSLLWCSIDNDDSKDLDQLSACEELAGGAVKILVAVADVDALVKKGTPLDAHAAANTTSVYTPAVIFPMLPERLSTDLTSLNGGEDRVAIVFEYVVLPDATVKDGTVYRALVHNYAKLAYNATAAWMDGTGPAIEAITRVKGMDRQIRAQDEVAQRLRKRRHEQGALDFQSLESRAVFDDGHITALRLEKPNRAKQLIEELMIASNTVSAEFLEARRYPSLRRIVRSPERWAKIAGVAAEYGEKLPAEPDSKALEEFLRKRREADPMRFPDLSLVIVKLMGRGEYVVEQPGETPIGHFGLAVKDYSHTTAPNRRFPDLLTHRMLKAAMGKKGPPYGAGELDGLAKRCTDMESAATKVERQVRKSAAALLLERRVGETFEGVITGAADKGVFVRVFDPPVEGRIVRGEGGCKVGDKVRVTLTATDFERGYLDFVRGQT